MPNHVTNIITIQAPAGRTYQEVLSFVATDKVEFDFNKLIPMPQEVTHSFGEAGLNPSWYRWSLDNWGTKWNAYEISVIGNVIRFDTAWSAPMPIFEALCKKFSDFTFDIKFADEDLGHNFGHISYSPIGMMIYNLPESGTPESRLWVCKNVKENSLEYIDENGNYIEEE